MAEDIVVRYRAEVESAVRKLEQLAAAQDDIGKSGTKAAKGVDKTTSSVRQLENEVSDTGSKIKTAGKEVDNFGKNASGTLSGLTGSFKKFALGAAAAIAAGFSIQAISAFAKKAVDEFSKFEDLKISFDVLIGDAAEARKLLADLEAFSVKTPFTPTDVQEAAKALKSFGIENNKLLKTVAFLGDVSAGTGKNLKELAIIFGQIQSTGRLMGQDLLQLINAGFNPLQEISAKTGKSVGELKKEMEKGAISADMVTQAFIDATSEGGKFFNLTSKLSQTTSGQISTIQGEIDQVLRTIGAKLAPAFLAFQNFALRALKSVGSLFGAEIKSPAEEATEALTGVRGEFNLLIDTLKRGNLTAEGRLSLIEQINQEYGKYLPNLLTEKSTLQELETAQKAVNEQIEKRILLIALEEEIEKLLRNAVGAQKVLLNVEKERTKNSLQFADNAGAVATQQQRLNNEEAVAKAIIADVASQIGALKDRFAELQKELGLTSSETGIANKAFDDTRKVTTDLITQLKALSDLNALSAENVINGLTENQIRLLQIFEGSIKSIEDFRIAVQTTSKEVSKGIEAEFVLDLNEKNAARLKQTATTVGEEAGGSFAEAFIQANEKILTGTSQLLTELVGLYTQFTDNRIAQIDRELEKQNELYDTQQTKIDNDLEKRRISASEAELLSENLEKEKIRNEKKAQDEINKLRRKQAIADKAQALVDIAINTAVAITRAYSDTGPIAGNAFAALVAALGAAQAALVLAQPLPKYAKGTKDAPGGMSVVGEKGAEVMYVPQGAKIIPNNKMRKNEALLDAMYDNRLEPYIYKNYINPALMRQQKQHEKEKNEAFAQSLTKNIYSNKGPDGPMLMRIQEEIRKKGVVVNNVDEIINGLASALQPDIYRR